MNEHDTISKSERLGQFTAPASPIQFRHLIHGDEFTLSQDDPHIYRKVSASTAFCRLGEDQHIGRFVQFSADREVFLR